MPHPVSTEKPLSSWKEISAYLGCDSRTCMRWERDLGLPVHRIGSAARSHVFAYRAELDQWLRGHSQRSPSTAPPRPAPGPRLSRLWLVPVLTVVLGLAGFGLFRLLPRKGQPADFRIEDSRLIILDGRGRELWRFDSGLKHMADEAAYRLHFQHKRQLPDSRGRAFPNLIIRDIDGDGDREVLFTPVSEVSIDGRLFCFDRQGRLRWKFSAGRDMTFGPDRMTPLYYISAVEIVPGSTPARTRVVLLCNHFPRYPSYVAVLSAAGKPLGEFWNSGRLADYVFLDPDKRGRTEMILVGTNNEYGRGCLVDLDLDRVRGCSPQGPDFRPAGLEPGSEKYYLLFPRTEVDRIESLREIFTHIDLVAEDTILAVTEYSEVMFELDAGMGLREVTISDAYRAKHARYQAEGRISRGRLDEGALRRALRAGVSYFDGSGWTSSLTPNRLWSGHE